MVLRVVTFVYACLHVYSCSSVSPLCIYSTGLLPCINLSIQEFPKAADTADKLAAMGLTSSLDYDTDDCEGVCVCVCVRVCMCACYSPSWKWNIILSHMPFEPDLLLISKFQSIHIGLLMLAQHFHSLLFEKDTK